MATKKTCPHCTFDNPVASHKCKVCGYDFVKKLASIVKHKTCPSCGQKLVHTAHNCPICDYDFCKKAQEKTVTEQKEPAVCFDIPTQLKTETDNSNKFKNVEKEIVFNFELFKSECDKLNMSFETIAKNFYLHGFSVSARRLNGWYLGENKPDLFGVSALVYMLDIPFDQWIKIR